MKKLLSTLLVAATSFAALAQGKIRFENDFNNLLFFGYYPKTADGALAEQVVPTILPSGSILLVDLYGGTTAGNLTLQTTANMSATPGLFGPVNFISNLPGGQAAWFQVQVRESSFATANLATSGGGYFGFSPIFTMTPSPNIVFNSIINHGGSAQSTWNPGTPNIPGNGPLDFGGQIEFHSVPEPSAVGLVGFGIATLLIQRARYFGRIPARS